MKNSEWRCSSLRDFTSMCFPALLALYSSEYPLFEEWIKTGGESLAANSMLSISDKNPDSFSIDSNLRIFYVNLHIILA